MKFQGRFISFSFFIPIMLLFGCGVLYKGENTLVRKLNVVMLTGVDLPTMELDRSSTFAVRNAGHEPPIVDGFTQSWNGTQPEEHIYVDYWLFQTIADAQRAADEWRYYITAEAIEINGEIVSAFQPEPNAGDVIGDGTWRVANKASIFFVKNNVLIYIRARRPKVNQLPLTRKVARKIEAKINAVLNPL